MSKTDRDRGQFHNKTESMDLTLRDYLALLRSEPIDCSCIPDKHGHYALSTRVCFYRKSSYPGVNMKSKRSQLPLFFTIDYFKDSSDYIQPGCQKGSCLLFKQNASLASHLVWAPVLYQTVVESKQNHFSQLLASLYQSQPEAHYPVTTEKKKKGRKTG